MFEAVTRARIMGLHHHPPEVAKQHVMDYLTHVVAKDDRRLMWIVEAAAETFAKRIAEKEEKIVINRSLGREDEAKKHEDDAARLIEDFRFVFGVQTLLRENIFQNIAAQFGEWLKRKKLPK